MIFDIHVIVYLLCYTRRYFICKRSVNHACIVLDACIQVRHSAFCILHCSWKGNIRDVLRCLFQAYIFFILVLHSCVQIIRRVFSFIAPVVNVYIHVWLMMLVVLVMVSVVMLMMMLVEVDDVGGVGNVECGNDDDDAGGG